MMKVINKAIWILILSLVILTVSFSCVSATDISVEDVSTSDINSLDVSNQAVDSVVDDFDSLDISNQPDSIQSLGKNEGSFSDLQELINKYNGTIDLDRDYIYNSITDSSFNSTGITISKNLVINGKGFTIDAQNGSIIFTITNSKNLAINNLSLINGHSSNYAGAINGLKSNNLSLTNVQFINNSANSFAGAICMGKNVSINNCSFINNFAVRDGGVLYTSSSTNLLVNNSVFINNSASEYGGVIFNPHNSNINNSVFINNFAVRDGGVLYTSSDLLVNNSVFINNAAVFGGAIHGEIATIINSTFDSNHGNSLTNSSQGAAIFASRLNLTDCSFVNNFGDISIVEAMVLNMTNCSVVNNSASYQSILKISDGNKNNGFILNSNVSNNSGRYGILYGKNCVVVDSIFSSNIAGKSGGVSGDNLTILNSTFEDNIGNFVGAILSINSTIANSTFTNNQGYLAKDIVALTNISLDNNLLDEYVVYNISSPSDISLFKPNYCIEQHAGAPPKYLYFIDDFYAYNSNTHEDVSELVKMAIYFFDNPSNDLQPLIWAFTDSDYRNYSLAASVKDRINFILDKYDNGFRVGDFNNTKILENGTYKIFNFSIALIPLGQSILTYNYSFINPADLEVIKVANETRVVNGSLVSWFITVVNNGPALAKDVIIRDILPSGFILVNGSKELIFNIGDLDVGDSWNITLETIAIATGNWTNIVMVNTTTLESNYTNNQDNATVEVINKTKPTPKPPEPTPTPKPPVPGPEPSPVPGPEPSPVSGSEPVVNKMVSTGNPLGLFVVSLFTVFVGTLRRKI